LGHKAKSELLIKDILLLGMDNAQIQHLPRCEKLPQLSSFAQQMGALYVLEGSVLGGRIISKRLKEQFGADIQDKLNFYGCYGENVGTEWKNFQNFMANQFDDKAEDMPEVVAAANATFLALQQWLDK
jgi:heme oxygenase